MQADGQGGQGTRWPPFDGVVDPAAESWWLEGSSGWLFRVDR
jgi:hypothetical protein